MSGERAIGAETRQRIYMEISDRQLDLIDQLLATGLYGTSRAEAVRQLMLQGLQQKVADGLIKPKPFSPDPNQLGLFE